MKKSTVITILAFALGVIVLAAGFVLLTDNNISKSIFTTTTTTTTTTTAPPRAEYEPMDLLDTDLSPYVTLGEYKGLTVEVEETESTVAALENQIMANLEEMLISAGKCEKILEGTVEKDVLFNFDYTGYLDGEAFSGGSDEGAIGYIEESATEEGKLLFYLLGGTQFIDGFADGILGAEAGSEFDIKVTFPESYSNTELAGKETTFVIKINYIVGEADFTDEWVVEETDGKYSTTEEYLDYVLDSVVSEANFMSIWAKIEENSEIIEIPEAHFNAYYYSERYAIEDMATSFGMSYEDFLASGYAAYFGYSYASDEELRTYCETMIRQELILYSIAKEEGLTITDDEYKTYLADIAASYNVTEEVVLQYYTEDYIRDQALIEKIVDLISDENTVTLKVVPDTEGDTNKEE